MTIILCAINAETGEVLSSDGSVAGKVVPVEATDEMHVAAVDAPVCGHPETASPTFKSIYDAMLAASRVDLSGCEVEVRRMTMSLMPNIKYSGGYNAAIQSILDQMPKVKK